MVLGSWTAWTRSPTGQRAAADDGPTTWCAPDPAAICAQSASRPSSRWWPQAMPEPPPRPSGSRPTTTTPTSPWPLTGRNVALPEAEEPAQRRR